MWLNWRNPPIQANKGKANYIIDWRANGGEWHYDREIPSGKEILDVYETIPEQFCGMVYGGGNVIPVKSSINKTYAGIPYSVEIPVWLKTNNLEFRIRYVYNYWDEGREELANRNSSFSAGVIIGTMEPKGKAPAGPIFLGSIPEPPASK